MLGWMVDSSVKGVPLKPLVRRQTERIPAYLVAVKNKRGRTAADKGMRHNMSTVSHVQWTEDTPRGLDGLEVQRLRNSWALSLTSSFRLSRRHLLLCSDTVTFFCSSPEGMSHLSLLLLPQNWLGWTFQVSPTLSHLSLFWTYWAVWYHFWKALHTLSSSPIDFKSSQWHSCQVALTLCHWKWLMIAVGTWMSKLTLYFTSSVSQKQYCPGGKDPAVNRMRFSKT